MTCVLAPSSLTAAGAAQSGGSGLAVLAVLVLVAGGAYLVACAVWPFAACRNPRCEGGRVRSPSGRSWRQCGRCQGSGMRLRVGRRVVNAVRTQREKGNR